MGSKGVGMGREVAESGYKAARTFAAFAFAHRTLPTAHYFYSARIVASG